ncbi:SEC-C domain-containing protein [Paeniglutamicibacter sp. ABSL32-1]|nr:YchJ family metal-binding protein [Paeniglutamicibacter quisquiliarum]MBV1779332.1 SEC-C domain-containing protein [Paeniglutamicibacter quisquiliarum]
MEKDTRCPCNSGETYESCCGRYHRGFADPNAPAWPGTAVALMRSRFSAFALGLDEFLLATWHPETRPDELELDEAIVWGALDIIRTEAGGPFDTRGVVEFEAHYRLLNQSGSQREVSQFVREAGRWYYVDAAE